MSFTQEGDIVCTIAEVKFAEPKFAKGPNDFDICIKGVSVADPNQSDYWRGEMSQNYGRGSFADRTQAQLTMETLRKIGFEGDDLCTLEEMIMGREVSFHVEASESTNEHGSKTFYNVKWIGSGGQKISEIDPATMKAKLTAQIAEATGATPAPVAPATPEYSQPTPAPMPSPSTTKLPF